MADKTTTQRTVRVSRSTRSDDDADRDYSPETDRSRRRVRSRRSTRGDIERFATAWAESTAQIWRNTARIWGDLLVDTNDAIWGFARDNDVDDEYDEEDELDDDLDEDRPRRRRRRSVVGSVAHALNESARATSDALDHFSTVNRPSERGRRRDSDLEDDEGYSRYRETREVDSSRGGPGDREERHERRVVSKRRDVVRDRETEDRGDEENRSTSTATETRTARTHTDNRDTE